MQFDFYSFSVT